MGDGKENPGNPLPFITEKFCDERFKRVIGKMDEVKSAVDDLKKESNNNKNFWRNIIGSIIGGGLVACLAWILTTIPH